MEQYLEKFIKTKLPTFEFSSKELRRRVRKREENVDHNSKVFILSH